MIGSLLYLTASRPYILFSVCLCSRFQSDPRESHLTIVKRIFKYLKGATNLGLLYRKSLDYKLVEFCDADYAGDRIERKSTSGNCNSLVRIWYPGLVKDKQPLLYQQQKQNTSQLLVIQGSLRDQGRLARVGSLRDHVLGDCWNKGVSQVTYWVLTITRY